MLAQIEQSQKDILAYRLQHWINSIKGLMNLEDWASNNAWNLIDKSLASLLKNTILDRLKDVYASGVLLESKLKRATDSELISINKEMLHLRKLFFASEQTIHFFADAINTRTNANIGNTLRGLDILCDMAKKQFLSPLGLSDFSKTMTYVDKGIGASILKHDTKLWDNSKSPVSVIKIAYHNLYSPCAAMHEEGHYIAHLLHLNEELKNSFKTHLQNVNPKISKMMEQCSSEIIADAIGFLFTGFASVISLTHVIGSDPDEVFTIIPNEVHPNSYIRFLIGIYSCKQFYGDGPWDSLFINWHEYYKKNKSLYIEEASLIQEAFDVMPLIIKSIFFTPMPSLRHKCLSEVVDAHEVSLVELQKINAKLNQGLSNEPNYFVRFPFKVLSWNIMNAFLQKESHTSMINNQKNLLSNLSKFNNQ